MDGKTSDTCIFCKIALKKIDAKIIDENENAIAFLDASPLTAGHTLVITKKHYTKLQEVELDQMAHLFNLLQNITVHRKRNRCTKYFNSYPQW